MNRSFSKIRHIIEANQKLEKRFLIEQNIDNFDFEDDDSELENEEPEIQDYGFDYEPEIEDEPAISPKGKKIPKIMPITRTRFEKGDENYIPFSPIKKTDMDLAKYLATKKKD